MTTEPNVDSKKRIAHPRSRHPNLLQVLSPAGILRPLASCLFVAASATVAGLLDAAPNHPISALPTNSMSTPNYVGNGDYCQFNCPPRRLTYGHYETSWRKWPGDIGLYQAAGGTAPSASGAAPKLDIPSEVEEAELRPRKRDASEAPGDTGVVDEGSDTLPVPEELPPELPSAADEGMSDVNPLDPFSGEDDPDTSDPLDDLPDLDALDTEPPTTVPPQETPPATQPELPGTDDFDEFDLDFDDLGRMGRDRATKLADAKPRPGIMRHASFGSGNPLRAQLASRRMQVPRSLSRIANPPKLKPLRKAIPAKTTQPIPAHRASEPGVTMATHLEPLKQARPISAQLGSSRNPLRK